ncbi:hypothetical protein ABI59_16740 [Acidobacteria bacterium Mor1]|nr:hypothetical protein ABI59_16740 [Acidobacteria bacterium Mor1]
MSRPSTEACERTDENLAAPALHPKVYAYLRRRLPPELAGQAEDLAQQTVMVALQARRKGTARRGSVLRYAYGVARNQLCSMLRRRGVERPVTLDEGLAGRLPDRSPRVRGLEEQERQARIALAMESLSALERAILHLRCVDGVTNRQAAATLGIAPEYCSSLKYRALCKLRSELTAPG